MKVGQGLRRQKTVENLRALQYAPHFLSFLLVGAGCGFLLVNALYNAMANEPELEKDGKTFGQFSIIQGAVGLASGLLYLFWNLRCPHCLTMRQEQVGVSILILSNVIAFLILSAFWSVGAPDYPVFVAGAAAAQVIGNFTIYLLFPMVSTYYAGWLVAPVRAGTDVSSLITSLIGQAQNPDPGSGHLNFSIGTLFFIYAIFSVCGLGAWASIMYLGTGLRYEIDDEGTVTLSESEDESDESRTWESDESECREFHVVRPHYGCLDGLACPRQLLLPVVLATLSQVAQWGIAASLGQIGAAMTDPVGCHGHQGKRVYRYALTSSMISVPIGSILSTAWNCPRSIFNALSCVQLLAAAVVGSVAMGFFEPLSSFMKTPEGQNMYIICFTLVGGLEGYLLTMAYRYVGDAIDVPGLRRQSASRLLSLLGVLAVNPFSFTIGVQISNGSIHCVDM